MLLVQTLFDPAQRRAAMPVDQDAVEIDRKEVETLTRWIESMDEPIRWQELRDDTDARLAQLVEAKLRSRQRQGVEAERQAGAGRCTGNAGVEAIGTAPPTRGSVAEWLRRFVNASSRSLHRCPLTLATKSSPRFTSGGARWGRFSWYRARDKAGRSGAKANWKAQPLRSWWRVRWSLTSRSNR